MTASAFKGPDGNYHVFLNAAVPVCVPPATINDSMCRRCKLGYSHVMAEKREICNECVTEAEAEHAIYWQTLLGIDLGWPMPGDRSRPTRLTRQEADGMHRVRNNRRA